MTNARQAWDDEQIAKAVGYTTSRFLGRGRYDTRRFDALAPALADAAGDRRAIVYAVTPEGFTIHITNGDKIATEQTMTDATTKTYSSRSNAGRAARDALKGKHREPMSGVHFRIEPVGDEFAWHEIDIATGQVASGELIADGVNPDPKPALPAVTQCPPAAAAGVKAPKALPVVELPNDTRSPRRKKADAEAQRQGHPNATRAAEAKAVKAAEKARAKTTEKAKAPKQPSQKQAAIEAAQRGELPTPPDFSADTHKRFRKTLEQLVTAARAGDLKALKADKTEPKSSSRQAMCRYRDLCITALEAQKKAAKAA